MSLLERLQQPDALYAPAVSRALAPRGSVVLSRGAKGVRAAVAAAAMFLAGCAATVPETTNDAEPSSAPGEPGTSSAVATSVPPVGIDGGRTQGPPDADEGHHAQIDPLLAVDVPERAHVRSLSSKLPVSVDVVSRAGGAVVGATDPWGRAALRFPSFSQGADPPRAIVRVTPHTHEKVDPLSPGRADFVFGADFAVDRESHGSQVDSGNNLLQRGLASDVSHFKIEVEARRPACRVQGPEGTVELRTEQRIQAEGWHRVRCSRTGTTVQLSVFRLGGEVPALIDHISTREPTGDLQWPPGTPLSIAGKLAANGEMIRSQTDQFNGLVTEPVFQIHH